MSSAQTDVAGWLKAHYEKLALLLFLVVLILSGSWLAWRMEAVNSMDADPAQWSPRAPREAEALDADTWSERIQTLRVRHEPPTRTHPLMVSELRVSCVNCEKPILFNAARCPFCAAEQPEILDPDQIDSTGDGIPDQWLIKHRFDPFDTRIAHQDVDGDGFTVLEEYLAGTDPNDPESFPPPVAKLRLANVEFHPFQLLFQGVQTMPDGALRYQLNLRSGERSHFVNIGDEVEGFKVASFEPPPDGVVRPGRDDDSVLVLQQPDGTQIRLEKNRPMARQERSARLVYLVDGSRFHMREGETFEIQNQTYRLVDIHRRTVVVEDLALGETTQIGLLSDEERRVLRGEAVRRPSEGPGRRPADDGMFMDDDVPFL